MRKGTRLATVSIAIVLAMLVAVTAPMQAGPGRPGPDRPVQQPPFTATLWTPPLSGELFFCQVANVSETSVTVKIEIVINQGFVVADTIETIPAGAAAVETFTSGGSSLCYCRLSLTGNPNDIRGSLQALEGTAPSSSVAVHAL